MVALVAASPTSAFAGSSLRSAHERQAALVHRIAATRRSTDALQARIIRLAHRVKKADVAAARILAKLVRVKVAEAKAKELVAAVEARIRQRAAAAFIDLGPATVAAYLLNAHSFSDMMDRTVMLERVRQADETVAARLRARVAALDRERARLTAHRAHREQVIRRLHRRRASLLDAFAAQQHQIARLVRARRFVVKLVGRIVGKIAMETGTITFGHWAQLFLQQIGAPSCDDNLIVATAWQVNEYTAAAWNPLATTLDMPGATLYNSAGVKNYPSLWDGLEASQLTLEKAGLGYGSILDDLRACAPPMTTAAAINASYWCHGCSRGGYVTDLVPIVAAYFRTYASKHI